MKIVGRPVWKWTLVDSPPMSQRSHIASSGRTAIWPCSVACSAPSRTSGGSDAGPASSSPSTYQSAWVGKLVSGRSSATMSITRGRTRRLRWKAITCSVTDTSPKNSSMPIPPPTGSSRLAAIRSMNTSVSFFGCVYQSPSKRLDDRPPRLDVELAHLVGAPQVQVDGAGVDGRERPLGLDRAEQLARGALDDRHRVRRGRAQRDVAGREAGAARQVAAVAAAPQLAERDQGVGALAPALAEHLRVGIGERQLVGGGEQVRELDPLVLVVEDRRLHRPLEELLRVAAEELVERVLAGDVERQPLAAPPGPAPHLAQARDRAGEGDADRRVELADVDPELERVGGDHREQLARRQARLDLPALLRRVAGPVGGDPLRELRRGPAPRAASA